MPDQAPSTKAMLAELESTICPKLFARARAGAPEETKDFTMQQTMVRVKDPVRSLSFYCDVLGMELLCTRAFPEYGFSLFFVGYTLNLGPELVGEGKIPQDFTSQERWKWAMRVPGCVELTWNHGSEGSEEGEGTSKTTVTAKTETKKAPEFEPTPFYNTGNGSSVGVSSGGGEDSKTDFRVRGGFGHLGISVPDVYEACDRFHKLGVAFHKSPNSGGMKGLAFIKDPDGYLVEVLGNSVQSSLREVDCCGVRLDGGGGYQDNSK